MNDLTELFCKIDDFWQTFKKEWDRHLLSSGKKRGPDSKLSISEMMTIMILFHRSNYRSFKHIYQYLSVCLKGYFPKLISYDRFVYIQKSLFIPFFAYLLQNRGVITGISFIYATSIRVCHNKRIRRNKVFGKLAKRGKTTAGWFYGFKLHLVINDRGEILAFQLTPGNVSMMETLSKGLWGKLFGDKGYISSEIAQRLFKKGL